MSTKTVTAVLAKKASNGHGFTLEGQDGWFNASETAEKYLAKIEEGTLVDVEYHMEKIKKVVTKISASAGKSEQKQETKKETTGYVCAKCGATMKTDKYPTCYTCSQKAKKAEPKPEPEAVSERKNTNNYNSPEKTAQIQRGNALNAAAASISGNLGGADPETIKEATLMLADAYLDWLRVE